MNKHVGIKSVTGIIKADTGNIVFSAEGFRFTLMKADSSDKKIILKADEHGYIWGITHEGKMIAIYSRTDVEIKKVIVLNTWNYIISKNNISKCYMQSFKGIRFQNGTIKTVYPCNALYEDVDKTKGNTLVYCIKNDNTEFQIKTENQSISWSFHSVVNQRRSIDEGDSLSNSVSILDIMFENSQNYTTFFNYYGYVCDLCSFLTFRNNVNFEKVYLLNDNTYSGRNVYAECFIKNSTTVSQRSIVHTIPIRILNETVFRNIILNILKKGKEHTGLPLFIIPKDDLDVKTMDVGKIRSICSALEMELDLKGVRLNSSVEMQKLIDSVKDIIREHRNGNNPLPQKTYDKIYGSISHWDQPLAERASEAWNQHKDEVKPLLEKYSISITQENIQEFVKARNNITHNGFTGISDEVSNTAFILMALIYCCTLTRIGMKSEEIRDIMDRRFIG